MPEGTNIDLNEAQRQLDELTGAFAETAESTTMQQRAGTGRKKETVYRVTVEQLVTDGEVEPYWKTEIQGSGTTQDTLRVLRDIALPIFQYRAGARHGMAKRRVLVVIGALARNGRNSAWIPAWGPQRFLLPIKVREAAEAQVRCWLHSGMYLFARADLGADFVEDLDLSDWEVVTDEVFAKLVEVTDALESV